MFTLPVRQYRCYPLPGQECDEASFGHVHRTLELDPAATALVTVDLWNMGFEPEPLVPDLGREAEIGFIGLGARGAAEARRIIEQNIAPVLRAARDAGLTIIHCNSDRVVKRYPECLVAVVEGPNTAQGASPEAYPAPGPDGGDAAAAIRPLPWPPPSVREEVLAEYVQHTWGEGAEERWERMRAVCDFPAPVRPQPGDFCVYQQPAFDQVCRERGITTLLYAGFLLAHCLMDKPGGLRSTAAVWNSPGYRAIVLRDCTLAQESAESIAGFKTTEAFIFWLEATTFPTATAEGLIGTLKTR
jgi:nicotinamidase-related amidase